MRIRDWQDGDEFDQLLDPEPDPLWVGQQHRFHGPPREGDRWRRTLVATEADQIVGAGSLLFNDLHADRYPASVEVSPEHRRQGIGRQLLAALLDLRPDPARPLESKVREHDAGERAFWSGARIYQRCQCPVIDPSEAGVRDWIAGHTGAAGDLTDAAEHFASLYRWLHDGWSPVSAEDVLERVAEEMVAEVDLDRSSLGWADGSPAAAAFVFGEDDGWTCVAETLERDQPGGDAALRAAVAQSLSRLDGPVEFDGHDSDPHLAPLLAELPWTSSDPLLLIELG